MKKVLSIILVLAMILSMSACGGEKKETGNEVKAQDLVMGTGSTGGTYFALGGAMANAINNKLKDKKISVTAQSTGASVENCNLIQAGEMDLGIAMNNVAARAREIVMSEVICQ